MSRSAGAGSSLAGTSGLCPEAPGAGSSLAGASGLCQAGPHPVYSDRRKRRGNDEGAARRKVRSGAVPLLGAFGLCSQGLHKRQALGRPVVRRLASEQAEEATLGFVQLSQPRVTSPEIQKQPSHQGEQGRNFGSGRRSRWSCTGRAVLEARPSGGSYRSGSSVPRCAKAVPDYTETSAGPGLGPLRG